MSEPFATPADHPKLAWFHQARFGMFIHWGVYSALARGEWVMNRERIAPADYRELARRFTARRWDPDAWAALARRSGCRYMVLTCRHHDGYSLFATGHSDFHAGAIGPGWDLVGDYVEACRRAGLRVGLYYSLADWSHPDYLAGQRGDAAGHARFLAYIHGQVRELLTGYGRIDLLWYDGGWPYDAAGWRAAELNRMARELQPEILINNRSRLPEDFDTPEQTIHPAPPGRAWESCLTGCQSWGWHAGDNQWKSPEQLLWALTRCAAHGGNLLLNLGPREDGSLPDEAVAQFEQIGDWMAVKGEAIYGSDRSPWQWCSAGQVIWNGGRLYCPLAKYPGEELVLAGIAGEVTAARLLGGDSLDFRQSGDRLVIGGLPAERPDLCPVVRIDGDGPLTFAPAR